MPKSELSPSDPSLSEEWLEPLHDPDWIERRRNVTRFTNRRRRGNEVEAIELLLGLIDDPDKNVRNAALGALLFEVQRSVTQQPRLRLRAALTDTSARVRAAAATALAADDLP